jgi:hypothetical protein
VDGGDRVRPLPTQKQLSASFGTLLDLLGVGERTLTVLQSVRCLECASVYTKPAGGGTAATNPGCPECGYLGWSPLNAQEVWMLPRYAEDRRPHRLA